MELELKLSNIKAGANRKEIVLRNLAGLLEREDLDLAACTQKRHGYLAEIQALHRKLEDTRKELEEILQ